MRKIDITRAQILRREDLAVSAYLTFAELKEQLEKLTPEQLSQPVQIMPPCPDYDKPIRLEPVYELDTVFNFLSEDGEEGSQTSRSAVDGEHHPEQVVLLCDYHPFDDAGNFCYELREDGMLVGDKTGEPYDYPPGKRPTFEFTEDEAREILTGLMASDHESLANPEISKQISDELYAVYPHLKPHE